MLSSPGRRDDQAALDPAGEPDASSSAGRGGWRRAVTEPTVRRRTAFGAAALAALVATALLFYSIGTHGVPQATPTTPRPSPSASPAPSIAQIFAALAPSVVFI